MNKYFALSLLIGMALEGSNNPLIKDEAFYDNGNKKYQRYYKDGKADGKADMKNLLGGKGANLAEMNLFINCVPHGFSVSSVVFTVYYMNNSLKIILLFKKVYLRLAQIWPMQPQELGKLGKPQVKHES